VLAIIASVLTFIFCIILISQSIKSFGYSLSDYALETTANPFIGLFIGLLSTALLQSSSTTTTIAVAAVSSGTISLEGAIPIILGANIGTTITSTIVSMGYVTRTAEFRKAVAAGTVHDFFNILMVLILFPIEIKYHLLQRLSGFINGLFDFDNTAFSVPNIGFSAFFKPLIDWLVTHTNGVFTLVLAIIVLFICIKSISKLLYNNLIGRTKKKFETTVFSNTTRSFGWGLLITSAVQSSSLTTSLIVPLVATNKVRLNRAFQFILGANIGTTITALLAATIQSDAAVQLAIVHLLFNTIGVIFFLFIPHISKIPIYIADRLGELTLKLRIIGFTYIIIAFFILPFTLIYLSKGISKKPETIRIVSED
jgi:sodium-dependent phosphate cotransporter